MGRRKEFSELAHNSPTFSHRDELQTEMFLPILYFKRSTMKQSIQRRIHTECLGLKEKNWLECRPSISYLNHITEIVTRFRMIMH